MIIVGTAGWSSATSAFAESGSHLSRYSAVLRGTEINSSFSRAHSMRTYAKWAATTPRSFRFAVKIPATITHECRLKRTRAPLKQFLSEVNGLGSKLGPLLVQLPPSLEFEPRVARNFFVLFRELYAGAVVCEPRHASWFTSRADKLLVEHRIGRVAADPAIQGVAAEPGGWMGPVDPPGSAQRRPLQKSKDEPTPTVYYRLHGFPRMYWSAYEPAEIERWAQSMKARSRHAKVWCIFDNTAGGAARMRCRCGRNQLKCERTAFE